MNSLMSKRTRASSSSNRAAARALASSVLPTPVGPRNKNEPTGRRGDCMPARALRIAAATAATASGWPITRSASRTSSSSSFWRSPANSCCTGMPVERATTSAMSPGSTCSRSSG